MKKRRAKPGVLVTRRVKGEHGRKRVGLVVAQPTPSRSLVLEEGRLPEVKTKRLEPLTSRYDDVSIDELRQAVEHMHGVPASYVETVEVDERFQGQPVWAGAVKVFALTGHPSGATRAYAWSYRTAGTRRKFKAVLGVPPVDGPVMAVRASILAEVQRTRS